MSLLLILATSVKLTASLRLNNIYSIYTNPAPQIRDVTRKHKSIKTRLNHINKVLSGGNFCICTFHPSVPSERWAAKYPALGLSAGTARTPSLQRSMSIARWNYPEAPSSSTAGQRKAQCWSDVDLFFSWITRRDSSLYPSVLTCGGEHTFLSDLWMATGPDVDLSTLAVWREADACVSKGGAERCSTRGDSPFHINSSVWTAL